MYVKSLKLKKTSCLFKNCCCVYFWQIQVEKKEVFKVKKNKKIGKYYKLYIKILQLK